jgi:hypothetical protein
MIARALDSKRKFDLYPDEITWCNSKRMQKHLLGFLRSKHGSTGKPVLSSLKVLEARSVPKNEGEWIA